MVVVAMVGEVLSVDCTLGTVGDMDIIGIIRDREVVVDRVLRPRVTATRSLFWWVIRALGSGGTWAWVMALHGR